MKLFGVPVKVEGSFLVLTLFLASGRVSEPALPKTGRPAESALRTGEPTRASAERPS
jgi:hypothetical protein